jgi:hypothetical protein
MRIRFDKIASSHSYSLLSIAKSEMIKSRERSSDAENRKQQVFEIFIARELSQFERVKMKTALNNQKEMKSKIKNVIHRADFSFERERERKREREREREQARRRRRVSTIAVKKEEIFISAVDEEKRERERDRKRSRERERRDQRQAASK